MAAPTVNFLSYNSTGFDTIKTKWLRDLLSVTKIDFCSIQEHFKKTVGCFFQNQFPEHKSYVIPAVRDSSVESG